MKGPNKPSTRRKTAGVFNRKFSDNDDKKAHGRRNVSGSIKSLMQIGLIGSATVIAYNNFFKMRSNRLNAKDVCGRPIPIDLSNHATWPTPYTPSYFENEPENTKEVVLLNNDAPYGQLTTGFSGFMHALDLAYDKKCPVWVSRSSQFIWDAFLPVIYGKKPDSGMMTDGDWEFMGKLLGVTVVIPNVILNGKEAHTQNSMQAFYGRGKELSVTKMRNRRDTIWRNLFRHSGARPVKEDPTLRDGEVCSFVYAMAQEQKKRPSLAKYSVIHATFDATWISKMEAATGRNLKDAAGMSPEYVKAILEPLKLVDQPIYLTGADKSNEGMQKLINDPTLKSAILVMDSSKLVGEVDGREIHLAVLADAFIGDPTSHKSLLIAKMRYALGMKNTFVFTERRGRDIVDALDQNVNGYSSLYSADLMGPWMG
jgi:hypothetical protein